MKSVKILTIVTAIILATACAACERSVGNDNNTNSNTDCSASSLCVEVAEDTPQAIPIPKNAQRVHYVRYKLTAPVNKSARVHAPILTRDGLGLPEDFAVVWIEIGPARSHQVGVDLTTNQVDFQPYGTFVYEIGAGETVYMDVYANMDTDAENSENFFCIERSDHVTAEDSNGNPVIVEGLPDFPLCGEPMTTTSAEVGVLNYDAYVKEDDLNDENTSTTEVLFEATVEDMDLHRFRMKQIGTIDTSSIVHVRMDHYQGSTPIDPNVDWEIDGDYVTITFPEPLYLNRGELKRSRVVVAMSGVNPCETVGFIIENPTDVEAVGRVFNFGVNTAEMLDQGNPTTRYIPGPYVQFAPSVNNPQDFDVLAGENDVTGLSITVTPQNYVRMWSFPLQMHKQYDPQEILDVKVWGYNPQNQEIVVFGPQDVFMGDCWTESDPTVFTCIVEFTDTFDPPMCEATELWVTFDTAVGAQSSTFDLNYLSPQTTFTYITGTPFPIENVMGGTINGPTIQIIN